MSSKPPFMQRPQLGKLKQNRCSYAEVKYYSCQGKLSIPGVCQDLVFTADDLADEGEIGKGAFGFVNRMVHKQTNSVMAVKRIRSTLNESEQTKTLKDLDVVMVSANCPHIVRFYGALFEEGDCWICMEMMATSLDKFYKFVYHHLLSRIPEKILGKITVATISALDYLKTELKVIHRDVKPSNILIDRKGNIKLCDFGISGQLVDSIAKSHDAGCKPYMAPERIHPNLSVNGYDIRSDVWSFGITLVELATGQFPYPSWNSVFEQLACVLNGDPPSLPEHLPRPIQTSTSTTTLTGPEGSTGSASVAGSSDCADSDFSPEFRDFVSQCLQKDVRSRPKYHTLMDHPFFQRSYMMKVDVGGYFSSVLDRVPPNMTLDDLIERPS
ncbi:unnamed protein product [Calicophoron daubneyi]|uniref:mitogen-activated protein kinase kinase n=1 Tax=Calicophoron daubneyi TaxID=300641 RepID=A0AAV2TQM1_CALDB